MYLENARERAQRQQGRTCWLSPIEIVHSDVDASAFTTTRTGRMWEHADKLHSLANDWPQLVVEAGQLDKAAAATECAVWPSGV